MTNFADIEAVDARFRKMGHAFKGMQGKIDALTDLISGIIADDGTEADKLTAQMADLHDALLAAPNVRQQCAVELAEAKANIQHIEAEMDLADANLLMNIYAELDDDNKPAYTNEKQRQAALVQARRYSDEWKELNDDYNAEQKRRIRLEAQLAEIEDRWKAEKMVYNGLVARLNNYTARIGAAYPNILNGKGHNSND